MSYSNFSSLIPLKDSRARNFPENNNFAVILSEFIGFHRVKNPILADFPYIDEYLTI